MKFKLLIFILSLFLITPVLGDFNPITEYKVIKDFPINVLPNTTGYSSISFSSSHDTYIIINLSISNETDKKYKVGLGEWNVTYVLNNKIYEPDEISAGNFSDTFPIVADIYVLDVTFKPVYNVMPCNYNLTLDLYAEEIVTSTVVEDSEGRSSCGSGSSGEDFYNILIQENDRKNVYTNKVTSHIFRFNNIVVNTVDYTGLKNTGIIVSKVEVLKNTSTMVTSPASDVVYTNLNVWVGNLNCVSSNTIRDASITFEVDKLWISNNNIDPNTIKLVHYSNNIWTPLSTTKLSDSVYKTSITPDGFGNFAITGLKNNITEIQETVISTIIPTPQSTNDSVIIISEDKPLPLFLKIIMIIGSLGVLIVVYKYLKFVRGERNKLYRGKR